MHSNFGRGSCVAISSGSCIAILPWSCVAVSPSSRFRRVRGRGSSFERSRSREQFRASSFEVFHVIRLCVVLCMLRFICVCCCAAFYAVCCVCYACCVLFVYVMYAAFYFHKLMNCNFNCILFSFHLQFKVPVINLNRPKQHSYFTPLYHIQTDSSNELIT
jgi:hypothetical protein